MQNNKQTIIAKAKDLLRLDRECIELSYEMKKPTSNEGLKEYLSELMTICSRAFETKNQIQQLLRDAPSISIQDEETLGLIRDIRDDKELYSVSQYVRVASFFNRGTDNEDDLWDLDANDFVRNDPDALQDFHTSIDHISYIVGTMRVGALISRRQIPESGIAYFNEIRESFAFGLYRSAIALCRAMLEATFFDTLKRRGYVKKGQSKVIKLDIAKEDTLFRLIKDAHKMGVIDYDSKEDAFFVKNQTNTMVLHAKDTPYEISEDLAFDIIRRTIGIVERLYHQ